MKDPSPPETESGAPDQEGATKTEANNSDPRLALSPESSKPDAVRLSSPSKSRHARDHWIERHLDFVFDELLRLDARGVIGWSCWQNAFVAYALGRRFRAWQAICAAYQWFEQLEWGAA